MEHSVSAEHPISNYGVNMKMPLGIVTKGLDSKNSPREAIFQVENGTKKNS